jgi:hypothetical protein
LAAAWWPQVQLSDPWSVHHPVSSPVHISVWGGRGVVFSWGPHLSR